MTLHINDAMMATYYQVCANAGKRSERERKKLTLQFRVEKKMRSANTMKSTVKQGNHSS